MSKQQCVVFTWSIFYHLLLCTVLLLSTQEKFSNFTYECERECTYVHASMRCLPYFHRWCCFHDTFWCWFGISRLTNVIIYPREGRGKTAWLTCLNAFFIMNSNLFISNIPFVKNINKVHSDSSFTALDSSFYGPKKEIFWRLLIIIIMVVRGIYCFFSFISFYFSAYPIGKGEKSLL